MVALVGVRLPLFRMIAKFQGPEMATELQYMRRKAAAEYLKVKYGHGSWRTLAKLAVTGGGPEFRKCGRMVVYEPEALDRWAQSLLGAPQKSTSTTLNA
jgi:hypothetical protein